MNLNLKNTDFLPTGIFGVMTGPVGMFQCHTLQHSYQQSDGTWLPKIPPGTYTCVRGMHQLENMAAPFETFEVTNVPGHTNILIHCGNYDADSSGCILVGTDRAVNMITNSKKAFSDFMALQQGVDSFVLTVS